MRVGRREGALMPDDPYETLGLEKTEPPRLYRGAKLSEDCPLWKMHHRMFGGHVSPNQRRSHAALTQVSPGACGRSNDTAALRPP